MKPPTIAASHQSRAAHLLDPLERRVPVVVDVVVVEDHRLGTVESSQRIVGSPHDSR